MKVIDINSNKEMLNYVSNDKKAYVLLYKKGSEPSECAIENLKKVENKDLSILAADVNQVRDIHPDYPVTSVPALLEFSDGEFKNLYKGCNDRQYYTSIFENTVFEISGSEEKPQKSVVVYSTPTCSWCTTLKNYFDDHKIPYRDIDVSQDQRMAEEMVKKSGQQGVPQTDINGEIIIGFDRPRINQLLGIKA